MRCEICGREIVGKPHYVIIEGAKLIACSECAKLGSGEWSPRPSVSGSSIKAIIHRRSRRKEPVKNIDMHEDITVIENFGFLVRNARQRMKLSQEDLGRKIGEKTSVIKKIEAEKIIPHEQLARKLEHALGVKLLVPIVEPEVPPSLRPVHREATLGEIAQLKESKRRKSRRRL